MIAFKLTSYFVTGTVTTVVKLPQKKNVPFQFAFRFSAFIQTEFLWTLRFSEGGKRPTSTDRFGLFASTCP